MKYELGEIICERDFQSLNEDGNIRPVKLQVSKPQVDPNKSFPDEPVWFCTHRILGIGDERVLSVYGVDSLQALMLSLETADTLLKHYAKWEHVKLTWLGQEDLDLPSPPDPKYESKPGFGGFEEVFEAFFRKFKDRNDPSDSRTNQNEPKH